MKTHTYNEITGILSADSFSNAELIQDGKSVGKKPKIGVKPVEWWITEVSKLTTTPTFEPGVYELVTFYDRAKKNKAKVLKVTLNANENTTMSNPGTPPQTVVITKNPDVLTYDQAINSVREIESLKHQVQLLTADNEHKAARIKELEDELADIEFVDEETEQMGDKGNGGYAKQLVETAIPILEKHFEHQDKLFNFKLMQFYQANPKMAPAEIQKKMFPNGVPPTQQPVQQQQQQPAQSKEDVFLMKVQTFFGALQQQAPDAYNAILPLYEQAQDMQGFLVALMQSYPQVYEPLIQFTQQP